MHVKVAVNLKSRAIDRKTVNRNRKIGTVNYYEMFKLQAGIKSYAIPGSDIVVESSA